MTLSQLSRLCFIGLSLCLVSPHSAQAKNRDTTLKLTPEICITSSDNQACDIDIELHWTLATDELICILSNNIAYPKWCSDSVLTKTLRMKIHTLTDIEFIMVTKDSNRTLAIAKLKITSAAQPQVRRRYRNPWSLF
ncbi:DUF3019 domain-containing protein [Shewanella glacialipiscicola]|uniref:DUF3019 domain-containing protein n=1 Tax=Shewanella glacialipiscicola TaxID=614069 RepID=UPI003D792EE3